MDMEVKHVIANLSENLLMRPHHCQTPIVTLNGVERNPWHSSGVRSGCYALQFAISFDMENYGYGKNEQRNKQWEARFQRVVHLIVTERHNVFAAVTAPRVEVQTDAWANPSNHDSCWRDDGLRILDDVASEAYSHCWGHVPEEHRYSPAMASTFVQFNDWHFGRPPFKIVKVKADYDNETHRYVLTDIVDCQFRLDILDSHSFPEEGGF